MSVRVDIERLIVRGLVPREALNIMLCHYTKRMLADKKMGTLPLRHHFMVIRRYENFRVKNRYILVSPKGKGLWLLKTQFAKKPKNPV